jgi:hypothetical protein
MLSAGLLAALGFYVLPYRRNKLKAELRDKIGILRDQLDGAMTQQFERELADSIQRMREAVSPYTRFVRVEREKLEQTAGTMEQSRQELVKLRAAVNSAVGTQEDAAGDVPVNAARGN